ncbi:uncharacterized protein LOC132273206 [Cornus florida]|uniref:uncharacterized protein LOC132273206 n=1 Tax=Cornus florida TaxID=4283 RepID=UPI0028A29BCE|nr:uncharacterized protein LOC132273206 [Cornus florida]
MDDFNAILHRDEKQGRRLKQGWMLKDFKHFLEDCELLDLRFKGFPFTWRNNRDFGKLILARLDRALAIHHWSHLFPRCMVHRLTVQGSDHHALLLCLNDSLAHFTRSFQFDARWVKEEAFKPLVERTWGTHVDDSLLPRIPTKPLYC